MDILFNILIKLFLSLIITIGSHYCYLDMLSDFIKDKKNPKYIYKKKMAFIICFISCFIVLLIFNIL